jgi:cytochrome d ubiquinol oxidase subunit I
VYGILRTADATSPVVGEAVAVTLALFVLVYAIVFSAGIYYINRLIAKGLQPATNDHRPTLGGARAAGDRAVREALRGG